MTIPVLFSLHIHGAPVAKARPRVGKFGTYTPKKTEQAGKLIAWMAKKEMVGKSPLDGALVMAIDFYLPIPASWPDKKRSDAHLGLILPISRPDVDNYIKQVMDALNGIAYADDSQIVEITARKFYNHNPSTMIRIGRTL